MEKTFSIALDEMMSLWIYYSIIIIFLNVTLDILGSHVFQGTDRSWRNTEKVGSQGY